MLINMLRDYLKQRFGLEGGRSRCSLLPPRSLRVVQFVSGHPRPVPRRGGPPAVVSKSHSSGESGDTGATGRGARCPAAAGAAPRGRPELAGPSINEGLVGGMKIMYGSQTVDGTYRDFEQSSFQSRFIFTARHTCTLTLLVLHWG